MKKAILAIITLIIFNTLLASKVEASSFEFSPESTVTYAECITSADLIIDPKERIVNAADIEIEFDPSTVEIIDSMPSVDGVQIENGNAFEAYVGNYVDEENGIIRLSGSSFLSKTTERNLFARIYFRSKPDAKSTEFQIKFDGMGVTTDSNIVESLTNTDILESVNGGVFNFTSNPFGKCTDDIQNPTITFTNLLSEQENLSGEEVVDIQVTDDISGINLNSISININGDIYTIEDMEVKGNRNDYQLIISPLDSLIDSKFNFLGITISDFEGNSTYSQILFDSNNIISRSSTFPTTSDSPEFANSITICHLPGTEQKKTDQVNPEELENHLEHGDKLGSCEDGKQINMIRANYTNPNSCLVENANSNITECFTDGLKKSQIAIYIPSVVFEKPDMLLRILSIFILILSTISFVNSRGILVRLIETAGKSKKMKKPYGLILDLSTNTPIQYAICKIYATGTKNLIDQTISDSEGRYGFPLSPGVYRLEVNKSGYETSIEKLEIFEGSHGHNKDIHLIPEKLKVQISHMPMYRIDELFERAYHYFNNIFPFFFATGFTIALFSFIYSISLINVLIFIVYVSLLVLFFYTKYMVRRQRHASVIDSKSALRIPNALVKIFEPNSGQLVDTKLTNNEGFFDYWGEEGDYLIHVSIRGYTFPSEVQTDIPKGLLNNTGMLKVRLNKGQNRLRILVDPIKSVI